MFRVASVPGSLPIAFALLLLHPTFALAEVVAGAPPEAATSPEQRTAQELKQIRADPLALRDFLLRMPKGADLHNHLDGAVYAETFIRVGGEDGLCVDQAAKAFTNAQPIEAGASPQPVCEAGDLPAAEVPKNQHLYDALVDSFSMRGFVPSEGVTGHDHFFGTFAKFGGTDPRHTGDFLHEVATRAAGQNEQYLELMATPTWHRLNDITKGMTWRDDLSALHDELLTKGLADDILAARAFWDEAEALRREREQGVSAIGARAAFSRL
jgi:adenosine deaminase